MKRSLKSIEEKLDRAIAKKMAMKKKKEETEAAKKRIADKRKKLAGIK